MMCQFIVVGTTFSWRLASILIPIPRFCVNKPEEWAIRIVVNSVRTVQVYIVAVISSWYSVWSDSCAATAVKRSSRVVESRLQSIGFESAGTTKSRFSYLSGGASRPDQDTRLQVTTFLYIRIWALLTLCVIRLLISHVDSSAILYSCQPDNSYHRTLKPEWYDTIWTLETNYSWFLVLRYSDGHVTTTKIESSAQPSRNANTDTRQLDLIATQSVHPSVQFLAGCAVVDWKEINLFLMVFNSIYFV